MSSNLPPGCSVNDIPGNSRADMMYEEDIAKALDILAQENALPEDERGALLIAWVVEREAAAVREHMNYLNSEKAINRCCPLCEKPV